MSGLVLLNGNTVVHTGNGVDHNVAYTVPLNTWTHICGTYTGANSEVFINGASFGAVARAWNTVLLGNSGLWIGQPDYAASQRFVGDIDDVRIYNRVLTAVEVRTLAGYHPMQVSSWSATPASSSLKLHYVPEQLGFLADGATITQWDDTSGHFMHAFQGTAGNRPQFAASGINNRPAVNFNNTRFFTRSCNDTNLGGNNTTILGAIRQSGNSGANRGLFEHGHKLLYLRDATLQRLTFFHLGENTDKINSPSDFVNLIAADSNMIYSVSHSLSVCAIY